MAITTAAAQRTESARAGQVFRPTDPTCFATGTRIAIPAGERPVEDLAEGDLVAVITQAGRSYRPISWIGRRRFNLAGDPRPDLLAPVRIRSDAIAPGRPSRDVLLAPDQGIFIDGTLIAARNLINDMTVVQETSRQTIEYHQVELEKHGILLADGLPAESYLGSRQHVLPASIPVGPAGSLRLWQQVACAPRVVDPCASGELCRRYAERARQRGFTPSQIPTQTDPDLHLVADGSDVRPLLCVNDQYSFVLPKGTRHVVLASRAGRLADTVRDSNDHRTLGVAVVSITLRGRGDMIVLPADALPAGTGWHKPETGPRSLRRWTDGAGELWFDALPDARIIDIKLGASMTYLVGDPAPAGLA